MLTTGHELVNALALGSLSKSGTLDDAMTWMEPDVKGVKDWRTRTTQVYFLEQHGVKRRPFQLESFFEFTSAELKSKVRRFFGIFSKSRNKTKGQSHSS